MNSRAILIVSALVLAIPPWRPAVAEEVDLELVLAVDVSNSIDDFEAALQRRGYMEALVHPEVIRAIQSGGSGRIVLTYVEWAGESHQRTVIGWTVVEDLAGAARVSARLAERPVGRGPYTSIGALIDFAREQLANNGYRGDRSVIDVSGDGPSNSGPLAPAARDEAVGEGITINGLPILSVRPNPDGSSPATGLDLYYLRNVIGGPGAFVMEANLADGFVSTLVEKLVREITGRWNGPIAENP